MKQKIIAQLKAKLKTLGVSNLSQKRIDAIADKLSAKITDETEIDGKLDELNDVYPFADTAKEDDRVRTLEANQKKPTPAPKPDDVVVDTPPVDSNTPGWAKALIEQNKVLTQKMEGLESGRTADANMTRLVAVLKEKKVPESFYKIAITGRTFKDNEELEAFATTLVEGYEAFAQDRTNNGLKDQPAPVMGTVKDPATEVSPMMAQYLKDKTPEKKSA